MRTVLLRTRQILEKEDRGGGVFTEAGRFNWPADARLAATSTRRKDRGAPNSLPGVVPFALHVLLLVDNDGHEGPLSTCGHHSDFALSPIRTGGREEQALLLIGRRYQNIIRPRIAILWATALPSEENIGTGGFAIALDDTVTIRHTTVVSRASRK